MVQSCFPINGSCGRRGDKSRWEISNANINAVAVFDVSKVGSVAIRRRRHSDGEIVSDPTRFQTLPCGISASKSARAKYNGLLGQ